jgi:hypothetical protein
MSKREGEQLEADVNVNGSNKKQALDSENTQKTASKMSSSSTAPEQSTSSFLVDLQPCDAKASRIADF